MSDISHYSAGRTKQLRILLWLAVGLAGLGAMLAGALAGNGYGRFSLFLAVPAGLVLVTAGMALRRLAGGDRAAKQWTVAAGVVLVLTGLLLAETAFSLLPSVAGILLVLLAVLRDVGER